ncbi:MAG: hypothetical protein Q9210_001124 [Variospora velana]
MKFLIISAVIGIVATGIPSANGAAIPEEAAADIDVKRSPEAQYKPCWIAADGQVHCPLSKREPDNVERSPDAQYKPCWIAADGQVHCPLSKREPDNLERSPDAQYKPCWIAADGQVHCPLTKREPDAQYKPCWIAADGQVHCPLTKREPDAQYKPCWIAADGQVHCPLSKRDSTKQLQVDPKYTTLDIPKQRECHKEKVPQAEGKFCQFPPCFDEVTVCHPPKMMEMRDAMPDGLVDLATAEN